MILQDLLNADIGDIWVLIRQGFEWWRQELAAMVPMALRGRSAARTRAEFTVEGLIVLRAPGAQRAEPARQPARRPRPVDLALPPGAVLVRTLDMPLLGPRDLRRAVALDLERLTSFSAEQVLWDVEIGERRPAEGRQSIRLAVVRRARAETLMAQAAAAGLDVRRAGLADDGGAFSFDFIRGQADAHDPGSARRRLIWRGAVASLLAINLLVLIGRDALSTEQLRTAVEAHHAKVVGTLALRRRAVAEAARRSALVARRAHQEPLRVINALTLVLPPGQWVQRLEWNGRTARVVGFRQPGFDVVQAVRGSPAFTEVRSLSSAEGVAAAGGQVGFDLAAEARRETTP